MNILKEVPNYSIRLPTRFLAKRLRDFDVGSSLCAFTDIKATGALFLEIIKRNPCKSYWINSSDSDVVNLWAQIKTNPSMVAELATAPYDDETASKIRSLDTTHLPKNVTAARTLYLDHYETGTVIDKKNLIEISELLQGVTLTITNIDQSSVVTELDDDDVVFCGPDADTDYHELLLAASDDGVVVFVIHSNSEAWVGFESTEISQSASLSEPL